MPCESFVPDRDPVREVYELLERQLPIRKVGRVKKEPSKLKQELDLVTTLLCELLSAKPKLATVSPELSKWWMEHQDWDKKREEKKRK